jgi:hypothetical protein
MENTALVVALFLIALAVLMQAVAMVGIWLVSRKMRETALDLKQRLDPLVESSLQIVNNAREPLQRIGGDLTEISRIVRARTSDVDALLAEIVDKTRTQVTRMDRILYEQTSNVDALFAQVLDKSRAQVVRLDRLISDLVQKIETISELMQRKALAPLNEVSAIVKGLQAGLQLFFSRQKTNGGVSETAGQDEQLFI